MITIVMAFYDRQQQLTKTLLSFCNSAHRDFNVVIVDDCSPEDIVLPWLPYKVDVIKLSEKKWHNAAPVFNLGIEHALKYNPEIIIIHNPECFHIGDVISYAAANVTDSNYISFGCFMLSHDDSVNGVDVMALSKKNNFIQKADANGDWTNPVSAWGNHPTIDPLAFHYCAAIKTSNLRKLNGFEERFSLGVAFEDDYLVRQVKNLGLKIEITAYPFVAHQWHKSIWRRSDVPNLWDINQKILYELIPHKLYRASHLFTPDFDQPASGKPWYLKVPKIMHTYWGGDDLPYIRYLTLKSFADHNPGWEVCLWTPRKVAADMSWMSSEHKYHLKCTNYLQQLLDLPIKIKVVDFDAIGFDDKASEVHKADFIRIKVMHEIGGAWTDMDVIYFNSMEDMSINSPDNASKETFVCLSHYGHSSGFMMSTSQSRFFKQMASVISKEFNPDVYPCIGPLMFDKYHPTLKTILNSANIPMDTVYAYDARHIPELVGINVHRFTPESIGCHWYAGHKVWGPFLNKTDGGLRNLPPSIISTLLRGEKVPIIKKTVPSLTQKERRRDDLCSRRFRDAW